MSKMYKKSTHDINTEIIGNKKHEFIQHKFVYMFLLQKLIYKWNQSTGKRQVQHDILVKFSVGPKTKTNILSEDLSPNS